PSAELNVLWRAFHNLSGWSQASPSKRSASEGGSFLGPVQCMRSHGLLVLSAISEILSSKNARLARLVAFFRANQLSGVFTFLAIRLAWAQSAFHQVFERLHTLGALAFRDHASATIAVNERTTLGTESFSPGGPIIWTPSLIRAI